LPICPNKEVKFNLVVINSRSFGERYTHFAFGIAALDDDVNTHCGAYHHVQLAVVKMVITPPWDFAHGFACPRGNSGAYVLAVLAV
jgi:hypothetical protein